MKVKQILVLTLLMTSFLFVGCDKNDKEDDNEIRTEHIIVYFKMADYSDLNIEDVKICGVAVKIDDKGIASCEVNSIDIVEGKLPIIEVSGYDSKIVTKYLNETIAYTVFLLQVGKANLETDLLEIGGCVVMHSNGETRLGGGSLYVNDNFIMEVDSTGNYTIWLLKGSVLSIRQNGYRFVDVTHDDCDSYLILNTDVVRFRAIEIKD